MGRATQERQALDNSTICVFAATGAIGSGTARVLAERGAHVWISGRDDRRASELADAIEGAGGHATAHAVDATDPKAVDAYLDEVVAGRRRCPASRRAPAPGRRRAVWGHNAPPSVGVVPSCSADTDRRVTGARGS